MADEEGKENAPKEWEVVSLTASAYAAAPGPEEPDPTQESPDNLGSKPEAESSSPLFMSRHFVFPPSQHENLPLEPELIVPQLDREGDVESEVMDDEDPHFYDKDVTFENAQSIYSYEEGLSNVESEGTGDLDNSPDSALGSGPQDIIQKPVEEDEHDDEGIPSIAWWKRRAVSMYAHVKEANTFWSVFIAAAIMGLVVIGHRWQQESWKVLHFKRQFGINDEREHEVGQDAGPHNSIQRCDCGWPQTRLARPRKHVDRTLEMMTTS
ncbi:ATP synthase subunit b [Striga asiatica]|uniref:ATP synthase subunit b n=1 Tax=Striga asiatica TaxID=4170 RepID=A0A5A7QZD4_STRAF|nr:ATP synthase subunit b [Striga asiatica]